MKLNSICVCKGEEFQTITQHFDPNGNNPKKKRTRSGAS